LSLLWHLSHIVRRSKSDIRALDTSSTGDPSKYALATWRHFRDYLAKVFLGT
jgi:hypothetical protein